MTRALFRTDAAPAIGGGHVMRCLTLAGRLAERGWDCIFACNAEAPAVVPALAASPYRRVNPDDWRDQADILVVDHYDLDAAYEKSCRAWAGCVMVIDDLANRLHDCDILLDQTFGRDPDDYKALVPAACTLLTGAHYALLRPAFAACREQGLAERDARAGKLDRILVSFGSSDPDNATEMSLDALAQLKTPLSITVVMGPQAPHLAAVGAQVGRMGANLLTGAGNMAELMMQADLCVGAGGITSWERCCLGLPALVVEPEDNKIALELQKAGAIRFLGSTKQWNSAHFLDLMQALKGNPGLLMDMSGRARKICDGNGAKRVCDALEDRQDER